MDNTLNEHRRWRRGETSEGEPCLENVSLGAFPLIPEHIQTTETLENI